MKKLVSLFPLAEEVHLNKDVGMMAKHIATHLSANFSIACFDTDAIQDRHITNIEKLSLDTSYSLKKRISIPIISYLITKSSEIDYLVLFHNSFQTRLYSLIYKLLNPSGKLYIKLDINEDELSAHQNKKASCRKFFFNTIVRLFFNTVPDVYSIETYSAREKFCEIFHVSSNNFIVAPNGIEESSVNNLGYSNIMPSDKEKIILTVGRIGWYPKHSEMMIDAIKKIKEFNGWKFVFAGPIESGFQDTIDAFINEYPEQAKNVTFTGNIRDRSILYSYYKKSSFYCCTSRNEGFSISIIESIYFACHLISTPVSSISEMTSNWRYGTKIHNIDDLSAVFLNITGGKLPNFHFDEMRSFAKKFTWENSSFQIAEKLHNDYSL